ncbi:hypothetical protein IQ250_09260 [Pseudanabaenaceae cyanobacterium LEGE 13415]|nr:hypothetical protein [Pseudanabaenaceae cyanobacterium LEGE 13415]
MNISDWLRKHSLAVECCLIFASCVYVYLANDRTITTHDSVPNTLLAFNWLFNHQLNFDNFRGNYFTNNVVWFFTESPNGHLTSAYPIGIAILTFPFYVIFAGIRWIQHLTHDSFLQNTLYSFNIQSAIFEPDRLDFEKLAGTLITSIAVVFFYLATRLKFNQTVCVILTFTYAFATQNWVTNSQSMLQHTGANLAVCSILLCLLKANRTHGKARRFLLLTAGIFCGFLPGIRPTDAVFSTAAIIYAIVAYRRDCIFLLLGLPSALLSISWNLYYFGSLLGGYGSFTGLYNFSIEQFTQASLGLLFSPARGLFTFSPVLLFMFPGVRQVFKSRTKQDEQLLLCLTSAGVMLFINYCFFSVWWASWTYGNRFLADALPVFCLLVGYALADIIDRGAKIRRRINYSLVCFFVFLLFSTFVQCVGAFTVEFLKPDWNGIPAEIDANAEVGVGRLWWLHDSPIERSARLVFRGITGLPKTSDSYFKGLDGKIERVQILNQPFDGNTLLGAPGNTIPVQLDLRNTGVSDWLGYDTGIQGGSIAVQAQFYDQNSQVAERGRVFIPGVTHPNHYVRATGFIVLPDNYGTYRLVLNLAKGDTSSGQIKERYELPVRIDVKQQVFAQTFSKIRVPKEIAAGKTAKLFTIVQSDSNFPWHSALRAEQNKIKHPVNFSYRWLSENGEVIEGEMVPIPWMLLHRKDWTFGVFNQAGINTTIKAPDRPGTCILRLSMFQEGVGWFDDRGGRPEDIPMTITAR